MTTVRQRERDGLKIRIGGWFEASATGRLGILVIGVLWGATLLAKAAGWA